MFYIIHQVVKVSPLHRHLEAVIIQSWYFTHLEEQSGQSTLFEILLSSFLGVNLTLCLPVLSADNLGKQFGPRSGR